MQTPPHFIYRPEALATLQQLPGISVLLPSLGGALVGVLGEVNRQPLQTANLHVGDKAGGLDKLKGKKIVHLYHDSAFGKESTGPDEMARGEFISPFISEGGLTFPGQAEKPGRAPR